MTAARIITHIEGQTFKILQLVEESQTAGQDQLLQLQQRLQQQQSSSSPNMEERDRLMLELQQKNLYIQLLEQQLRESRQIGEQLFSHLQTLHQQIKGYKEHMEDSAKRFITAEQSQYVAQVQIMQERYQTEHSVQLQLAEKKLLKAVAAQSNLQQQLQAVREHAQQTLKQQAGVLTERTGGQ